ALVAGREEFDQSLFWLLIRALMGVYSAVAGFSDEARPMPRYSHPARAHTEESRQFRPSMTFAVETVAARATGSALRNSSHSVSTHSRCAPSAAAVMLSANRTSGSSRLALAIPAGS